jgi:hypothetical protein
MSLWVRTEILQASPPIDMPSIDMGELGDTMALVVPVMALAIVKVLDSMSILPSDQGRPDCSEDDSGRSRLCGGKIGQNLMGAKII